ncbi:DUF1240 domain-containing protein [Pseudoalteromonas sp.]|uniref:DUF1240 domain-containing protein n=1 Tax=Pseudoalteromonas sp. TaxID=53249 RepID=UPI003002F8AF
MSILEWQKSEERFLEQTFEHKLTVVIGLVIFVLFSTTLFYFSYYGFVENVYFDDSLYYIREIGLLAPIIAMAPFPVLMTIAGFQRVLNYRNEKTIKLMVKLMLWAIPLYIVLSIANSFYIESKLVRKGYSFCHWYTSPSFRGPDVWLKNDELCLQDGSVIISDIADWFEVHNEQGTEPTLNELEAFIKKTRMELGR